MEDEMKNLIQTLIDTNAKLKDIMEALKPPDIEYSVSDLKKRIKYSKSLMEKKMYEQELNRLYKKKKRSCYICWWG